MTETLKIDEERAKFEAWFEDAYGWSAGEYPDQTYVEEVWQCWQASCRWAED